MPPFHLGLFAIVVFCFSCNNNKPNKSIEKVNVNTDNVIKPLAQKPQQHAPIKIPDSIQR
jgi:hypothetical protein